MNCKKVLIAAAGLTLLMSACKSEDPRFPGYEKTESGSYFKEYSKGDQSKAINAGDVIFLRQIMTTEKDSVLFDYKTMMAPGEPYAVKVDTSKYPGDMFEMLLKLHVGDSVSFCIPVDTMWKRYYNQPLPPFLAKGSCIKYYLKVDSAYSKDKVAGIEKKNREAQQVAMEKYKVREDSLIASYVAQNKITVKPSESGLYFIEKSKGKGPKLKPGDMIEAKYKGMFTNGKVFDSSEGHPEAFVFQAGVGQVIPGWDEALMQMSVGSKAMLIVPSQIAYGPQGSGPIGPFTPLVFEMEVVSIKPAPANPK
ncbi:MAG: FKBP-type peptidyl-prolyl cis-trans isomerase [Bacteroidia bacterium]